MCICVTEKTHFLLKPITKLQFAFRKGHSTETALSRTINKIEKALEDGIASENIGRKGLQKLYKDLD